MLTYILLIALGIFLLASVRFVIKSKNLIKRVEKKLPDIINQPVSEWSREFLERKRAVVDPFADDIVRQLIEKNETSEVNHLFESITKDSDKIPDKFPKEIHEYFEKSAALPEWADQDLIALGQQIYIRHGIWISLLLSYKSLPECYACAKGAEVLYKTARLNEDHGSLDTFSRRIAETAQFVMFVMLPGGLSENGRGVRSAQKVRLIHAIIRYYLWKENWDVDNYDQPVNHEDQAGTLMSFSALILEGLKEIGIEFTPAEKEAYIHCWRVVGHLVGLEDDIIPKNAEDALKQGYAILDHQIAESDHSKILTKALIDFQDSISPPFMRGSEDIAMLRLMMGDEISDLLGVPACEKERVEKLRKRLKFITKITETLDKSLVFSMVIQFVSRILLHLTLKSMTKSNVINFYLPKSLTKDWGIKAK